MDYDTLFARVLSGELWGDTPPSLEEVRDCIVADFDVVQEDPDIDLDYAHFTGGLTWDEICYLYDEIQSRLKA